MSDLEKELRAEATEVRTRARNLLRRCALSVLRNVVMGTPVGNKDIWLEPSKAPVGYVGGRARANWFVALGGPSSSMVDAVEASGGMSIGRGEAVIRTATHASRINITNNLPYIGPLNDGHSKQAPAGFIDAGVTRGMADGMSAGLKDAS